LTEDPSIQDDAAAGEAQPVDATSPPHSAERSSGFNPKYVAAAVGATVLVVIVLSQLFGGGGEGDEPRADSTLPLTEDVGGDPLGLFSPADDRPEINPIRACDLLTDEVLFAGLGSEERGIDDMGNSKRGQGEACAARLVPESSYFVAIEPGDPSDFAPGAALGGAIGETVDNVSDGAIWFGGDPAFLSVHTVTGVGDLVFRVSIGRPDLSEDGRRGAAAAVARAVLPLFPAVEAQPPELAEIVFDTQEPPATAETFHGLVAAGEESGKWTQGGGLVAALRFLLGEPSEFEPPSDPDLFTGSATGVLLMAIDYAENGDEEARREEIKSLLGEYSSPEWSPPAEASAVDGVVTTEEKTEVASVSWSLPKVGAAPTRVVRVAHTVAQAPGSTCLYEDRSVYGPDEPTCQPVCFWQYRSIVSDKFCLEEINTIEFYYPEALVEGSPIEGSWNGWERADLDGIRDGIIAAGPVYALDGQVDNIVVHISNYDKGLGVLLPNVTDPDQCDVYLTKPLQGLPRNLQAFSVAIDIAGCLIHNQLPDTVFDEAGAFLWWYRGLSTYFAAKALPESDIEWDLIEVFEATELTTSLQTKLNRSSNWTFFRHVASEAGGASGAFDLVGALSNAPTMQEQQEKLAAQPGADRLLQTFHETLSDSLLVDVTDRSYDPQFRTVPLSRYTRMKQPIMRFGVARYHVKVPAGQYACFEDRSGNVELSWRPGEPGPASGFYTAGLPNDFSGDATVVVTTVHEDQSFDALVRLFSQPGCGEDDDDDDVDLPELCDFCDPSLYYRSPGSVAGAASQPPDEGDQSDEPTSEGGDEGDGSSEGGDGDSGGEAPPPGAGSDVEAWLSGLCPANDEWLNRIAITDGVDPTTLDLDERIERANQHFARLVDAADDFLDQLDSIGAPPPYGAYQQRFVGRVTILRDDMQGYLDDEIETLSDLSDAGLEMQAGLEFIVSEARRELNALSAGDRELFDATADRLPECALLPR
jgi:hypothetical protein